MSPVWLQAVASRSLCRALAGSPGWAQVSRLLPFWPLLVCDSIWLRSPALSSPILFYVGPDRLRSFLGKRVGSQPAVRWNRDLRCTGEMTPEHQTATVVSHLFCCCTSEDSVPWLTSLDFAWTSMALLGKWDATEFVKIRKDLWAPTAVETRVYRWRYLPGKADFQANPHYASISPTWRKPIGMEIVRVMAI